MPVLPGLPPCYNKGIMKLSVVLPVHNEAGNIRLLARELDDVCGRLNKEYEIIWVDDGSTDESRSILQELAAADSRQKLIILSRNFGQTAAMAAGITAAKGDIIIPMDADGQNDPADIPRFLEKISEGFDVVSGWRKDRKDKALQRKLPWYSSGRYRKTARAARSVTVAVGSNRSMRAKRKPVFPISAWPIHGTRISWSRATVLSHF